MTRQAHLRRALDTHARPNGFDRLVEIVRHEARILVLDIEENAGRTAHAEALAARLAGLTAARDQPPPPLPPGARTDDFPGVSPSHPDLAGHGSAEPVWQGTTAPPDPALRHQLVPSAGGQHRSVPGTPEGSGSEPREVRFDVARLMFGGSPHFPESRLPTEQGRVWLLEIPTDEEGFRVDENFSFCLPALDRLLAARHGRLIVLTRPDQWRRIGGGPSGRWPSARELLAGVGPTAVAHAQLTGRMPDIDVRGWLEHPSIRAMVEHSGTVEVFELAENILAAEQTPANLLPADHTSAGPADAALDAKTLLERRIAMVVDSRGQWRRQLLDWHRHPGRTAFERDFQVAAAALTGLPVTHVYHGATELNKEFGGNGAVSAQGQDAPGVIAMLDAINGELTADDRIRFTRPGWTDSILEYFWVDRPLGRLKFLDWLARAPGYRPSDALEGVSDDHRRAAARRITRFALGWAARHKREAPLAKLASAWREPYSYLWYELVAVLSAVACADNADPAETDPDVAALAVHQRYVHQLLLDWAKSPEHAHVVLQVCAGPFADRYTSKALVRLKHAGRHNDDKLQPVLQQVIARLWQESSARTTLVKEIASWCDAAQHRTSGSIAFARLATITDTAQPHPDRPAYEGDAATKDAPRDNAHSHGLALLRQTGDYTPDRSVLARCWRAHLVTAPPDTSENLVTVWLEAAMADPSQRQVVLEVLRLAVRGSADQIRTIRDVVRGITRIWSIGVTDRVALYQELTAALDTDIHQNVDNFLIDGASS
ncbi:hypothetical protein KUTG_02353 [Kutzneria sp. 744]|nr:hypothetical protein KUTG_02353 [Kutzneria sp. 744]